MSPEQKINPRYLAMIKHHGDQPNWSFINFIAFMKREYLKGSGIHQIVNHGDFTKYIEYHSPMLLPPNKDNSSWQLVAQIGS